MIIQKGSTITFEYTLTLEDKEVIDSNVGADPLTFTHGSSEIISGLEDQMCGMKKGERKQIVVPPEDGYGPLLEEAIIDLKIEQVPVNSRRVGAMLQTQSPEGQIIRGRITEVDNKKAVIDLNHPLAGKTLYFDVTILDVK
ncbi:MAG: peptidylprolyl isomerase [Desulfobacterales bacterium]|jgi:FKBP-type peptidyl-prolyl cis-trans isomerase SlyD